MPVRRARLGTAQERGAELGGARAGGQHGRDARAGADAARGDQRQAGPRGDELEQRQQAEATRVGGRVVAEGAAVPAGLAALHDQHVGAGARRLPASAGLATVTHTSVPASCSAVITPGSGQPKVNDVTGSGSAVSRASFAAQSSSSKRGEPSATPAARASASSVAA